MKRAGTKYRRQSAPVAHSWAPIRKRFIELFELSGRTQADVARLGGLNGQHTVSKILANDMNGPTLDVFVKAVAGLGISLAEFFEPWHEHNAASATRVFVAFNAADIASIADAVAARLQPSGDVTVHVG